MAESDSRASVTVIRLLLISDVSDCALTTVLFLIWKVLSGIHQSFTLPVLLGQTLCTLFRRCTQNVICDAQIG